MPRTRCPASVPIPTSPDQAEVMWVTETPDGQQIENRVFPSDPRPGCRLCGDCVAAQM